MGGAYLDSLPTFCAQAFQVLWRRIAKRRAGVEERCGSGPWPIDHEYSAHVRDGRPQLKNETCGLVTCNGTQTTWLNSRIHSGKAILSHPHAG